MQKPAKKDLLQRSRLQAVIASYKVLMDTVSIDELTKNRELRNEMRKIRRQLQFIEELNESFE